MTVKPLDQFSAVSEVELLRLSVMWRDSGDKDMTSAQIARVQSAITEADRKIEEVELAFRNEAGKDLAETMAKLEQPQRRHVALSDKVTRSDPPLTGQGNGQTPAGRNTVGGVIQPGKDVIEIVPLEDNLCSRRACSHATLPSCVRDRSVWSSSTAYDFFDLRWPARCAGTSARTL